MGAPSRKKLKPTSVPKVKSHVWTEDEAFAKVLEIATSIGRPKFFPSAKAFKLAGEGHLYKLFAKQVFGNWSKVQKCTGLNVGDRTMKTKPVSRVFIGKRRASVKKTRSSRH